MELGPQNQNRDGFLGGLIPWLGYMDPLGFKGSVRSPLKGSIGLIGFRVLGFGLKGVGLQGLGFQGLGHQR